MRLPPDIHRIIYSKNTDILLDWSEILFFFEDNKDKLTKRQKKKFYKRSEEYRTYWNTPRSEKIKIDKNGVMVDAVNQIQPLNIEIEDIHPNDLYLDKSIQEDSIIDRTYEWFTSLFSVRLARFQPLNIFYNLF